MEQDYASRVCNFYSRFVCEPLAGIHLAGSDAIETWADANLHESFNPEIPSSPAPFEILQPTPLNEQEKLVFNEWQKQLEESDELF